ncbi:MAG: hypothetical protein AAF928_04760 [Myxococcota bacterium]
MRGVRKWFSVVALQLLGCGGGMNAAEMVRPEAPTASDALADTVACSGPQSYAEPLIVDWSTSSRTDLEVAMQQGVAVVRYDCDALRLVNGCRLPARYAFAGVSPKEELIRMDNADEVRANLPVSGVRISAGMNATSVLDLALVMVGKRTTTLGDADAGMLEGSCEGATHYVRAASVGAFAMDRSSSGEVRAAADLFVASTGAKSRSGRSNFTRDGDRKACKRKGDEDAAPRGCAAALRLELVPIAPAARAAAAASKAKTPKGGAPAAKGKGGLGPSPRECPENTVWRDSKCAPATAEERLCWRGNLPACDQLCDVGDGWACTTGAEGILSRRGANRRARPLTKEEIKRRFVRAQAFADRGCKLRHDRGCALAGQYSIMAVEVLSGANDGDFSQVAATTSAACDRGGPLSCLVAAEFFRPDTTLRRRVEVTAPSESAKREQRLLRKGCDLGSTVACRRLADALRRKDPKSKVALELLQRACEGGDSYACKYAGDLWFQRERYEEAAEANALVCIHSDNGYACRDAALLFLRDDGPIAQDPDRAMQLAQRGCELGSEESCEVLAEHGSTAQRRRGLQLGCDPSRGPAGFADLCEAATDDSRRRAGEVDRDACFNGDALACERHATRQLTFGCRKKYPRATTCIRLNARAPEVYRELVVQECFRERGLGYASSGAKAGRGEPRPWCEAAAEMGLVKRPPDTRPR